MPKPPRRGVRDIPGTLANQAYRSGNQVPAPVVNGARCSRCREARRHASGGGILQNDDHADRDDCIRFLAAAVADLRESMDEGASATRTAYRDEIDGPPVRALDLFVSAVAVRCTTREDIHT
jgi:hypothetical protein